MNFLLIMGTQTTSGGVSRGRLAEILTPEAMDLVRKVDRAEMQHGTHWRMAKDLVYTRAGLELAWERLRQELPGDALALRAEIDALPVEQARAEAQAARLATATAGARRSDAGPFWWQRD